eukprot:Hpha_TRINITY_DN11964_c0_g1::TRINITY_DN11964_c0_g1_i1::g.20474::m.20474/K03686/dnaJ; molecular chaperone DnaJ
MLRRCRSLLVTAPRQDFYGMLGVGHSATLEDIKKAYKKKAATLHPDVNKSPTASEDFARLSEAYQTLNDERKRRFYDYTGSQPSADQEMQGFEDFLRQQSKQHQQQSQRKEQEFWEEAHRARDMRDFRGFANPWFDGMGETPFYAYPQSDPSFGHGPGNGFRSARRQKERKPAVGKDVKLTVKLTFSEAIHGCSRVVDYTAPATCRSCRGTGSFRAAKPTSVCSWCNGEGVQVLQMSPYHVETEVCGVCRGTGESAVPPCEDCRGKGVVQRQHSLSIGIPPGVGDGVTIRVAGKGGAVRGEDAPVGDAVLQIVAPSSFDVFSRKGADLHVLVAVPLTTAVLGGAVRLPRLGEKREELTVNVPAGSRHGSVIIMAGKGLYAGGREIQITADGKVVEENGDKNRHGDLHAHVCVVMPQKLSKLEENLFRQVAKHESARSLTQEELRDFKPLLPSDGQQKQSRQEQSQPQQERKQQQQQQSQQHERKQQQSQQQERKHVQSQSRKSRFGGNARRQSHHQNRPRPPDYEFVWA